MLANVSENLLITIIEIFLFDIKYLANHCKQWY